MAPRPGLAALAVTAAAFALYRATLLPGLDFGDTASFQTMAGSPIITPRDGYPLYFAVSAAFLRIAGGGAAHALNLASAVEAAIACGLLTLVAAEVSGSVLAGLGSALLFAGSYTFWSQSIIAEVYALHMLLLALTLGLLLRWEQRPTLTRLGTFFAVYALAFGNHLSMVLLAPAYALFLLASAPRGWRSIVTPPVIAIALAAAICGALPYAWNLRTLWFGAYPPHGLLEGIRTGWFDITKADWRETMVLGVPLGMTGDHASMYLFDLLQQFGWAGPLLAAAGLAALMRTNRRRAALIVTVYAVTAVFAYSYNVGDTHVFYLPSHMMIALLAAPGAAALARALTRGMAALVRLEPAKVRLKPDPTYEGSAGSPTNERSADSPVYVGSGLSRIGLSRITASTVALAGLALTAYAAARVYRDYPALDRSDDHRPATVLSALTAGLDDRHAVLLTDLNWQVQNGLSYYGKNERPELAYARMADVLLYAPALIRDNLEIARDVALTPRARDALMAAYGPLIPTVADRRVAATGVATLLQDLAPGTPYVLAVLKPSREFTLDAGDLGRAVAVLTAGRLTSLPEGDYAALAGLAGEPPALMLGSAKPFRRSLSLGGVPVEVRMESWLSADTIRRMGFGHVIAARRHALIIERGVSLVTFDRAGRSIRSGYAASIFAPQPRYLCYR